jgi:processive 1,2-diacylglycerol beta-glucosyltransferase
MILVKPLPGQEERNTRYLVARRAAIRARGEQELARAVTDVLTSDSSRARLHERMATLRHPDAARDVAQRIVELLDRRTSALSGAR